MDKTPPTPTDGRGGVALIRRLWRAAVRPRGSREWDLFLRATALVGSISIPLVLLVPASVPLVWFGLLCVPANSVLAPLIPVSFEVLIIDATRYASPWSITVVGTAVYMVTEYLNWQIYSWVLTDTRWAAIGNKPWVERSVRWFGRAPFLTVVLFAFTPLPFWLARALAVLDRYSRARFMLATALGRMPRIFAYAWLGTQLQLSTGLLLAIAAGALVVLFASRLVRRRADIEPEPAVAESLAAQAGNPRSPS